MSYAPCPTRSGRRVGGATDCPGSASPVHLAGCSALPEARASVDCGGHAVLRDEPSSLRALASEGVDEAARSVSPRRWDTVREFALGLPAAEEDAPWGEPVIKVRKRPGVPPWRRDNVGVYGPMFLWLGPRDAVSPAVSVKLAGSYDEAVAIAHAKRTTMSGLGQWGWLTVPLAGVDIELLCDWVEESYRNVAPRRLIGELDARRK